MADITITAANVVAGTNAVIESGSAGETLTAGKVVAKADNGRFMLADNNSVTASLRVPRGVALNGASAGQPLFVQRAGEVVIGATLTAGTEYWLSDAAGGICPRADLTSGESVVLLGIAKSTTVLNLDIQVSGVSL